MPGERQAAIDVVGRMKSPDWFDTVFWLLLAAAVLYFVNTVKMPI